MCFRSQSRKFHIENSQTLVFRQVKPVGPENLEDSIKEELEFHLNNFRPYFTHDIAFWVNNKFDRETFERVCKTFSKGLIKRITFLSQYSLNDDKFAAENLRTFCFRLLWQSHQYAMTREACRDMQICLRSHLRQTMPDSVSFLLR